MVKVSKTQHSWKTCIDSRRTSLHPHPGTLIHIAIITNAVTEWAVCDTQSVIFHQVSLSPSPLHCLLAHLTKLHLYSFSANNQTVILLSHILLSHYHLYHQKPIPTSFIFPLTHHHPDTHCRSNQTHCLHIVYGIFPTLLEFLITSTCICVSELCSIHAINCYGQLNRNRSYG